MPKRFAGIIELRPVDRRWPILSLFATAVVATTMVLFAEIPATVCVLAELALLLLLLRELRGILRQPLTVSRLPDGSWRGDWPEKYDHSSSPSERKPVSRYSSAQAKPGHCGVAPADVRSTLQIGPAASSTLRQGFSAFVRLAEVVLARIRGSAAEKSKKLRLERHFIAGDRSIVLLLRDSQGRRYKLWLTGNACPEPQWRRLRVLLRWPDATKG